MVRAAGTYGRISKVYRAPADFDPNARPAWLLSEKLGDHRWEILTSNPTVRKLPQNRFINFDVCVAPDRLLTHPSLERDLSTIKLMVYAELSPGGMLKAEQAIVHRARMYMQFVRWRLNNHLFQNRDLTPEWLEELKRNLNERGVARLVPSADRIRHYADEVFAGTRRRPVVGEKDREYIDVNEVLFSTGFSSTYHLDEPGLAALRELTDQLGVNKPKNRAFDQGYRLKNKGRSESTFASFLSVVPMLWTHRKILEHDPIQFQPFAGKSALKVAAAFGTPTGRTQTIQSELICSLVERSLSWVLDYSPTLIAFRDAMEGVHRTAASQGKPITVNEAIAITKASFTFPPSTLNTPWPIGNHFGPDRWNDISKSVEAVVYRYLPVACMIVIAAFSARRKDEILSLVRGCCARRDSMSHLTAYIGKLKIIDKIPVPESVVRAVEVLETLGYNVPNFIFDFDNGFAQVDGVKRRVTKFDLMRNLSKFSELLNIVDGEGKIWRPKPHQFRRFFAVIYFNRFRFPHLTALSVFLRHNNLEVTRRYVTERHRGEFIEEPDPLVAAANLGRAQDFFDEEQEFISSRLTLVLNGQEEIGGWGGEAIKRRLDVLVADARARLELASGQDLPKLTLETLINELAGGLRLEPHGSGHGYCKCTHRSEDIGVAACIGLGRASGLAANKIVGPLPAFASDEVCSTCPHHVQFCENESYWNQMWREADLRLGDTESIIMRSHLEERKALSDVHLKRWFRRGHDE